MLVFTMPFWYKRYKYVTECYSHLYEVATKSAQFSDWHWKLEKYPIITYTAQMNASCMCGSGCVAVKQLAA